MKYIKLLFLFLYLGSCTAESKDVEILDPNDIIISQGQHLRYDIQIIDIPEIGFITQFTKNCMISKGNPTNLVEVKAGDKLEHKDRLVARKGCSLSIKFGDEVLEITKEDKRFDYVFYVKSS